MACPFQGRFSALTLAVFWLGRWFARPNVQLSASGQHLIMIPWWSFSGGIFQGRWTAGQVASDACQLGLHHSTVQPASHALVEFINHPAGQVPWLTAIAANAVPHPRLESKQCKASAQASTWPSPNPRNLPERQVPSVPKGAECHKMFAEGGVIILPR